jgi:uncharacterized protein (DUF427 family)
MFFRRDMVERHPVGPGQESVWDYPRPPRLEKCDNKRVMIVFNGVTLVDTMNTYTNKETSHPPCYYFSQDDLKMEYIHYNDKKKSYCEWKGECFYWDVKVNGKVAEGVGFSYSDPTDGFKPIKGTFVSVSVSVCVKGCDCVSV